MLICLNPLDRVVYILGDIIGLESKEASEILDIKADNFRQILHRSRQKIRLFMTQNCGLVNPDNSCRCTKKIDFLISRKLLDPENLQYANRQTSIQLISKIEEMDKSLSIFRSTPNYRFPDEKLAEVSNLINSIKVN
jgi:hypothetical protein